MNVHMEEISMDVIEELGNYSIDISKTIEEELSCIVPNNLQEASIYIVVLVTFSQSESLIHNLYQPALG